MTLAELERAAESGDVTSQLAIADRYSAGQGTPRNLSQACKWFERAATSGEVKGMTSAAWCYSGNHGIPRDSDSAIQWWQRAAEKGSPKGEFEFGRARVSLQRDGLRIRTAGDQAKKTADEFVLWETRAADQNYAPAMHYLGMTYLLGVEPPPADGGLPQSKQELIQPDINKGIALLKRSADSGYYRSQWALAVLYQAGYRAIKPDKGLSDKYWKLLSDQTSVLAAYEIGRLYSVDDEKDYTPGKNKYQGRQLSYQETNEVAREWFERAATQSDDTCTFKKGGICQPASLYQLGLMYRDGRGTVRNAQKAFGYFKRSAELDFFNSKAAVALAYDQGSGVVRNYGEALKWWLAAANENESSPNSPVHRFRNTVGSSYETGAGTAKDLVIAYAWYNVAAAGGDADAQQNATRLEGILSPDQLKDAQSLSSNWSPGLDMRRSATRVAASASDKQGSSSDASAESKLARQSVGSGFFISPDGFILTNNHVIADCGEIRVPSESKVARTVVADAPNDLAVIKLDVNNKRSLTFPSGEGIQQGEDVYVFGFPLEGFLPASGNFTPGMVAALAGPGNNSSLVQITAPVQPGNSGGPVVDIKGHVVGVVVGKADALKIAKATGDIPQNINFSIAPQTIQAFLGGNRIRFEKDSTLFRFNKSAVEIAELARAATVKVECWR
jgi:TPR repeat protein